MTFYLPEWKLLFLWWVIIYTTLFFKWLNLNHVPSLCDCHWLSLSSTVGRFDSHLVFSYKSSLDFQTIVKFGRTFMPYFWEWVGNVPRHWPFVRWIHQSPVVSFPKNQKFGLWCSLCCYPEQVVEKSWVTSDLRRLDADAQWVGCHCDVPWASWHSNHQQLDCLFNSMYMLTYLNSYALHSSSGILVHKALHVALLLIVYCRMLPSARVFRWVIYSHFMWPGAPIKHEDMILTSSVPQSWLLATISVGHSVVLQVDQLVNNTLRASC